MRKPPTRSASDLCSSIQAAAFAAALICLLTLLTMQSMQAQTLTVLHSFTGGSDGATPRAELTLDRAGNLYGTASAGGVGHGTVFKVAKHGSSWLFLTLYSFQGVHDGAIPRAGVTIGPDGSLFGTTLSGGIPGDCNGLGCGTVFNLRPPPTRPSSVFAPWNETVLHRFSLAGGDDFYPYGDVTFDAAGNLYGTVADDNTYQYCSPGAPCGGCVHCGAVYELSLSGNSWTESILYRIPNWDAGAAPLAGVVFDPAGNLYGTTSTGGNCGYGTAYELSPTQSGWTEQTILNFCGGAAGADPSGGLLFASGALYGGSPGAAAGFGGLPGSVFTFTSSGGGWNFTSLYQFGAYGVGPASALTIDAAGNLYGTTALGGITGGVCGSNGCGTVFKLSPSGGGWNYSELYNFTGANDGYAPYSSVSVDSNGNLYGTTSAGGANGYGTVWEITP